MSKSKLRKQILRIRKKVNKDNIKINFDKIISLFKKEKIYKKNIGGYFPVNYEVDDLDLLRQFKKNYFDISLPVIKKNYEMDFYKWSFVEPLKIKSSFGPVSSSIGLPIVSPTLLVSKEEIVVSAALAVRFDVPPYKRAQALNSGLNLDSDFVLMIILLPVL